MDLDNIIDKVSKELGLPKSLVNKTYRAYWQFIKASISELPLKENLTEEEFNKLKVNFNIPSIGKLYCTYSRYIGMKKRFNYIKALKHDKYKEN